MGCLHSKEEKPAVAAEAGRRVSTRNVNSNGVPARAGSVPESARASTSIATPKSKLQLNTARVATGELSAYTDMVTNVGTIDKPDLRVLRTSFEGVGTALGALSHVLKEVGVTLPWVGPAVKFLSELWDKWRGYKVLQGQIRISMEELRYVCEKLSVVFDGVLEERNRNTMQWTPQMQQEFWKKHFHFLREAMCDLAVYLQEKCSSSVMRIAAPEKLAEKLQSLTGVLRDRLKGDLNALNADVALRMYAQITSQVQLAAMVDSRRLQNVLRIAGVDELVGREEDMKEVIDAMFAGESRNQRCVAVLRGIPGVGKTTTALAIAGMAFDRRSVQHAVWVGLRGEATLFGAFVRVLQAMDELESSPGDSDNRRSYLEQVQKELKHRLRAEPWCEGTLLVLDNAEDLQRGGTPGREDPLTTLLGSLTGGNTRVIVTTRQQPALQTVNFTSMTLKKLEPEHAQECFMAEYARHTSEADATALVQHEEALEQVIQFCGGLPLALRNMAAAIASPLNPTGIVEMADSLPEDATDASSPFLESFQSFLPDNAVDKRDVSYNLFVALDLSMAALARTQQGALQSLSLFPVDFSHASACALMEAATAPEALATRTSARPNGTTTEQPCASGSGSPSSSSGSGAQTLAALVEAALVEPVGLDGAGQKRFSLHPVVRRYAAWRLEQQGAEYGVALRDAFTAHFMGVVGTLHEHAGDVGRWHARLAEVARTEQRNLQQMVSYADMVRAGAAVPLASAQGQLYKVYDVWNGARGLVGTGSNALLQLLGRESVQAWAEKMEAWADVALRGAGWEDAQGARALSGAGGGEGEDDGAAAAQSRDTALLLACARLLKVLGDVHWRVSEEHERAWAALERAAGLFAACEGRCSAGLADALNFMAIVRSEQERYEEALALYAESLAIKEALPEGRRSARCANTLNNMGLVHRRQRRYDAALERFSEALAIYEALAGGRRSVDCAWALRNMGHVRYDQGRDEAALALYEEARAIYEAFGVGQSVQCARALNAIASVRHRQRRYEEALALYGEALQMCEACVGPGGGSTGALIRRNMANTRGRAQQRSTS